MHELTLSHSNHVRFILWFFDFSRSPLYLAPQSSPIDSPISRGLPRRIIAEALDRDVDARDAAREIGNFSILHQKTILHPQVKYLMIFYDFAKIPDVSIFNIFP